MHNSLGPFLRPRRIQVSERTHVAFARREAARLVEALGLAPEAGDRVALGITELATNLLKHAGEGTLLLRPLESGAGVEILSVDRGPGIQDSVTSMKDGTSTAGSLGLGLGSVERLSDEFSLYSYPGNGTVVLSRIGEKGASPETPTFGVVCFPKRGEEWCGDGWFARLEEERLVTAVFDGSGHGTLAAQATHQAVTALQKASSQSLSDQSRLIHEAVRQTRGCAGTLVSWNGNTGRGTFLSVGNVRGRIATETTSRGLVNDPGIWGVGLLQSQVRALPLQAGLLVLHSDGISTRWKLPAWEGLINQHPAIVAAVIYRECLNSHDDSCILVVRLGKL